MVGDALVLEQIAAFTTAGRTLLCALARRGKRMRRDQPARATALLASVSPHPLYKIGRLMFDMAEIEDVLLDGEPPPSLDDETLATLLGTLRDALRLLTEKLAVMTPKDDARHSLEAADLPALEAADYLFDLVVLGWIDETSKLAVKRVAAKLTP
jgi:hypothetical protein